MKTLSDMHAVTANIKPIRLGMPPVTRRRSVRPALWRTLLAAGLFSGLLSLGLPLWAAAPAKMPLAAEDALVICDNQRPADSQDEDCVEFGAALGTLGLSWRQQLPGKVRWLMRRDAADLCQQTRSEFGDRASGSLKEGCVFVSGETCTIVTARVTSHAELGNAVRNCQP